MTPGSTAAPLGWPKAAPPKQFPDLYSASAPIRLNSVSSIGSNRPGGNATGVSYFTQELGPKRLALLRELMPGDVDLIVLANPRSAAADSAVKDIRMAVSAIGQQIAVLNASDNHEIDAAFTATAQKRAPALSSSPIRCSPAGASNRSLSAARHAIPAIYTSREFAEVGGLMSYGANLLDINRQVGMLPAAFSNTSSPSICPWCSRPGSNLSLIWRRPGLFVSKSRQHCSPSLQNEVINSRCNRSEGIASCSLPPSRVSAATPVLANMR